MKLGAMEGPLAEPGRARAGRARGTAPGKVAQVLALLICCGLVAAGCGGRQARQEKAERLMAQAQELLAAKDFKGAEETLLKAAEVAPELVEARLALADFYNAVSKHEQALAQLYVAQGYDPTNPKLLEALTVTELSLGHFQESIKHARKLMEAKPKDVLGHNYLAVAYIQTGEPDRALAVLREALQVQPGAPLTHKNLGDAKILKGDLQGAIEDYREAVELGPGFAEAHDHLAVAYVLVGEHGKAEKHYLAAIEADPNFVDSYCDLALLYADHMGKLGDASKYATKAVEVNPMVADSYDTLGWVRYREGNYGTAIAQFEEAARLAPEDPSIKAHLGMALCKGGDEGAGVPLLREAVKHSGHLQHEEEARAVLKGCSKAG